MKCCKAIKSWKLRGRVWIFMTSIPLFCYISTWYHPILCTQLSSAFGFLFTFFDFYFYFNLFHFQYLIKCHIYCYIYSLVSHFFFFSFAFYRNQYNLTTTTKNCTQQLSGITIATDKNNHTLKVEYFFVSITAIHRAKNEGNEISASEYLLYVTIQFWPENTARHAIGNKFHRKILMEIP